MRTPTGIILLAAAALAATPAAATQGQTCRPLSGRGPQIDIVIGSLGIVGASVSEDGVTRSSVGNAAPLAMRQAWIDEQRLWIDLTDADHMRDEGRLRLHYAGRGRSRHFAGSFVRGGRLYRLRCQES